MDRTNVKHNKWLKTIRINKKITVRNLANRLSCDYSYISKIENGERLPSVKFAKKIANLLNFEWTDFFKDNSDN